MSVIRDFQLLASSPLRRHALDVIEAGLRAADPAASVRRHLRLEGDVLRADGASYDLRRFRGVWVVGAGKASAAMACACVEVLGSRVRGGLVVVPEGQQGRAGAVQLVAGGHPLPTAEGETAARRIAGLLGGLGDDDLVIALFSGGGSALLPLPADGVTLDDKVAVTRALLLSGAPIEDVNAVRKHLSTVKGGGLARLAVRAAVLSLLASDVVGDRLDVIASGPTVPDPTTFRQALAVLERFGVEAPPGVAERLRRGARGEVAETPKPGDPCFERVHNLAVLSMASAVEGAAHRARHLGYDVLDMGMLEGEARDVAGKTVELARRVARGSGSVHHPAALVSGGETTVAVRGGGRGGRNQEFALAALPLLGDGMVLAAVGTDGVDGNTDAAGAVVDAATLRRARELGLDWRRYLQDNDSHAFFRQVGGLVSTGPTHTNVADLRVLLVGPAPGKD